MPAIVAILDFEIKNTGKISYFPLHIKTNICEKFEGYESEKLQPLSRAYNGEILLGNLFF